MLIAAGKRRAATTTFNEEYLASVGEVKNGTRDTSSLYTIRNPSSLTHPIYQGGQHP